MRISDWSSDVCSSDLCAPDRAKRSSLDYLALGDWRGTLKVEPRTWYAGTPETDGFQRDEPGHALMIELAPGVEPKVEPVRTGRFQWLLRDWTLQDTAAFSAESDVLLSAIDPAATLLRLSLAGITSLADRVEILSRLEDDLRHRLRFLDVRADDLVGRPGEQDLAALNVEGLLGIAAEKLTETIAAGGTEAILAPPAMARAFGGHHRGSDARSEERG